MGFFNLFKRKPESTKPLDTKKTAATTDNGVQGPTFLDGLTEQISNPKGLKPFEWRRQLRTPSGQTKFKIKYYGRLHRALIGPITGTDFAPALVFAVDVSTGLDILLFDGCLHGCNAMLCDSFTAEQMLNRPAETFYNDKDGNDLFEIVISTYNQIDYDDELSGQVDENGFVLVSNGSKMEFENVKRNGYGFLQISGTNEKGKTISIVEEELA